MSGSPYGKAQGLSALGQHSDNRINVRNLAERAPNSSAHKPSKWLRCRRCGCLTLRAIADAVPDQRGQCAGCGHLAEPCDLAAEYADRKRQAAGDV